MAASSTGAERAKLSGAGADLGSQPGPSRTARSADSRFGRFLKSRAGSGSDPLVGKRTKKADGFNITFGKQSNAERVKIATRVRSMLSYQVPQLGPFFPPATSGIILYRKSNLDVVPRRGIKQLHFLIVVRRRKSATITLQP
jgi:hypothetical protein